MSKVIYTKYNQNRNEKFQTRTSIIKDGDKKYVIKSAANEAAKDFVNKFPEKYNMTKSIYLNMDFLPCDIKDGVVYYDFLKGKSLDSQIEKYTNDVDKLVSVIKGILDKYFVLNDNVKSKFVLDEKFKEVFGEINCSELSCIKPVNLDVILDNLIMQEDGTVTVYDYEWVFDMTVPVDFVLYRILSRIYDKYFSDLSAQIDFEDFVKKFDIESNERSIYEEMEKRFIKYVYDNNDPVFSNAEYRNGARTIDDLNRKLDDTEYRLEDMINEHAKVSKAFIEVNEELNRIRNSKMWKVSKPVRFVTRKTRTCFRIGLKGTIKEAKRKIVLKKGDYIWKPTNKELEKQRKYKSEVNPKISILTPLFKTPDSFLREMIDSVVAQTYENWELCLVDFSPADYYEVENIVKEYDDSRIKYYRDENVNIPENTNTCIEKATGDYLAILDHDDILHPSALYMCVKEIDAGSDFVYTDEIKFEGDLNHCYAPNFKPDFAPEDLLASNYICHFNVFKKSLLDKAGLYRTEANGSQDHDVVLRMTKLAEKIAHVPYLLYFWRNHPGSVASNIDAKPYATLAGIWSVEQRLKSDGYDIEASSVINNIPIYRLKASTSKIDDVLVVVYGNNPDEINKTKESLLQQNISNADIVCVDDYVASKTTISDKALNEILEKTEKKYVLLIREGTVLVSDNAINEMRTYIQFEGVAVVDSKVIDENEKLYSAGVSVSNKFENNVKLRGKGANRDFGGFENAFIHARNVSAALGICTLIDRSMWLNSDVEIDSSENAILQKSFKMTEGRVAWTPFAEVQIDGTYYDGLLRNEHYRSIGATDRDPYFSDYVIKYSFE